MREYIFGLWSWFELSQTLNGDSEALFKF